MVKESLIKKLLGMEIGELRERLAYQDSGYYVEEWLCDCLDDEEEVVGADEAICDRCDVCDGCCECDEYDDEEEIEKDYCIGMNALQDEDQEAMAEDIADDILAGKYPLDVVINNFAFTQELKDRVKYLVD